MARSYLAFSLLLAMTGAMIFVLVARPRTPHALHTPSRVVVVTAPVHDAGVDAAHANVVATTTDAGLADAAHDAAVAPRMDRPLRVVTLGWSLAAPGIVANGGTTPSRTSVFADDGLIVHIDVTTDAAVVESALARGGGDPHGADIALVPLPTFVASYERLRALAPGMFFVVGWSHGGEGVATAPSASLTHAPATGEVRLAGAAGDAATFVSLFLLDQAGVAPTRVQLLATDPSAPADASGPSAAFFAVDRTRDLASTNAVPRRLAITTADASRLVPYVAVVPDAFARAHGPVLQSWARGWLAGIDRLRSDVPAGARAVAAMEGAPDALGLLQRLGLVEQGTLNDNARAVGLAGRGAVTLDALFQQSWRLWRGVGVLTTPAPEVAPLSTDTVATMVRADPSRARASTSATAATTAPTGLDAVLLAHREPGDRVDDAALTADVGLLAGVFERSTVRVTVRNDAVHTRAAIANARERFDLGPTRLISGSRGIGAASVEVLPVP